MFILQYFQDWSLLGIVKMLCILVVASAILAIGFTILVSLACAIFALIKGAPFRTVVKWFFSGIAEFLIGIPITIEGLFVVAVALPFRKEYPETAKPYETYPEHGNWLLSRLPKWALQWDNPVDGVYGDIRGWWANENGGNSHRFWPAYIWTAIRNPANYYSRITSAIDTTGCKIRVLIGNSQLANQQEQGWFFAVCERDGEFIGALFQVCIVYPFSKTNGLYCRFGYKIDPTDQPTKDTDYYDLMRSSVWKCSPYKEIL